MISDTTNPPPTTETQFTNPFQPTADPTSQVTQARSGGGSSEDWQNQMIQEFRRIVGGWAKDSGYSANAGQMFVNSVSGQLFDYLNRLRGGYNQSEHHFANNPGTPVTPATDINMWQNLLEAGLTWLGARLPFSVPQAATGGGGFGGGGGGRGGGLTAADIRSSFDLTQLSSRANELSRAFLIQELDNPRSIAKAYVDAVVSDPNQKLDYDTFVTEQLKKDPRWNIIMGNRPEGMDPQAYAQHYAQQIFQVLGGGPEANQIAFEQAALGSSNAGVAGRLERTRANRSSSNYVNNMESRLQSVSELLR